MFVPSFHQFGPLKIGMRVRVIYSDSDMYCMIVIYSDSDGDSDGDGGGSDN